MASALYFVCAISVYADGMVDVQSVLLYPESFYHQILTLKGTVIGVVTNAGRPGSGEACVQDFTLDDGTGTIPVRFLALCVDDKAVKVHEGDRVVVKATVDVPPDNVGSNAEGNRPPLRAIATEITKSDD